MNLKEFGITLRELLRYGYSGTLAMLLLHWLIPHLVAHLLGLGNSLVVWVTLFLGAGVYSVFKYGFADPFLVPLIELMHPYWDRWVRKQKESCCLAMLRDYGVPKGKEMDIYRLLRGKLSPHLREVIHLQNTEVSMVQLTFFECLIAVSIHVVRCIFAWCARGIGPGFTIPNLVHRVLTPEFTIIIVVLVITFCVGILGQWAVCRQEHCYLAALNRERIRKITGIGETKSG